MRARARLETRLDCMFFLSLLLFGQRVFLLLIGASDGNSPDAKGLRRPVFAAVCHRVVFRALHLRSPIGHSVAFVETGRVDADVGVFGFIFWFAFGLAGVFFGGETAEDGREHGGERAVGSGDILETS